MPQCQAMYTSPPSNLKGPLYWWTHDVPADGHASMGGAFAVGANYGAYSGAYFFGDLEWTRLWAFQQPAAPGQQLPGTCPGDAFACDLAPAAGIPGVAMTAMHQGPNGDLFINDIEGHRIMELRFGCGGNCPPVAVGDGHAEGQHQNLNTLFTFDGSASSRFRRHHRQLSLELRRRADRRTAARRGDSHLRVRRQLHRRPSRSPTTTGRLDTPTVPLPPTTPRRRSRSRRTSPALYSVGDPVKITATAKDENGNDDPGQQHPMGARPAPLSGRRRQRRVPHPSPGHADRHDLQHDRARPRRRLVPRVRRATATDGNGLSTTAHFNLPMDEHTRVVGVDDPRRAARRQRLRRPGTAHDQSDHRLAQPGLGAEHLQRRPVRVVVRRRSRTRPRRSRCRAPT